VAYLIRRDIARSLGGRQRPVTVDAAVGDRQASLAAVGAFVIMLLIGAIAWNNAVNRQTAFNVGGFSGDYPASFGQATGEGDVLRVVDTLGTGAEFAVVTLPVEASGDARSVAATLAGDRATTFELYKVTSSGLTTVNSKPAFTQQFVYVDPNGLTGAAPEVREGIDYIFVEAGRAVVVTLLTSPDEIASVEPQFARFLNNLQF
jgi:hypothetical protein